MPVRLVGQNYTTPDLVAKVTGRARYAEDYRAEGMLFCKLLLSPMPHCRVRRHRRQRGAGHARRQGDPHRRRHAGGQAGGRGRAGARGGAHQRAGLPGRADAGDRRGRRGHRRRGDRERRRRRRAAAVRGRSDRQPAPGRRQRPPAGQRLRRRQDRHREVAGRRLRGGRRRRPADGRQRHPVGVRRCRRRLRRRGAGARRDLPHQRHRPRAARDAHGDGLLAERQALPARLDAKRGADGGERRPLDRRRGVAGGDRQRVHRRRLRQQDSGRALDGDSGAAGQEGRRAGDDAHQPRGRALHRPHPAEPAGPRQGRVRQGRPDHGDRSLRGAGRRALRGSVRSHLGARHLLARLPAAGDALPRHLGADQQPAAHLAALSRRDAAERHPRAGARQGRPPAGDRHGRTAQGERALRQGAARPPRQGGQAQLRHQRLRARSPRQGRRALQLAGTQAAQPAAARRGGARRRRGGEPVHRRLLDQLRRPADDPARRPAGGAVGGRQPRHSLGDRHGARAGPDPRRAVGQGRRGLGRHQQAPAVDLHVGRQPDDPRDDPRQPCGGTRRDRQAARDRRGGSGRAARGLRGRRRARVSARRAGTRPDLRAGGDARDRARRRATTATSCPTTSTR